MNAGFTVRSTDLPAGTGMDLLQLMAADGDRKDKALDRLAAIVLLLSSDDPAVREEAQGRALTFAGKEWGSYRAALEALALRLESDARSDPALLAQAMEMREEADNPGFLARAAEQRLEAADQAGAARRAVIERYGDEAAARGPTALEMVFVTACAHLADTAGDDTVDPWAPLAGWGVAWHPVPAELARAVRAAMAMPATIADARAEVLSWDQRLADLDILAGEQGRAALPTACAARRRLVEDLWRRDLPAASLSDLDVRLHYWATRGAGDQSGYGIVRADLARLLAQGTQLPVPSPSTRAKCQQLRADNPAWSLARIGQELGISRQAVHKHLTRPAG